ncbi:MAG TPA: cupredoxin family copper-binding protein [Gemmatimonadales bacterium]|nr:cupredoxin family copper-binding protein [Gemmatimonadales bacterium]
MEDADRNRGAAARAAAGTFLLAALLAGMPGGAAAQGVVDRTPDVDDGWTVRPGVIQFNFLHRFQVSKPPARKVTSFPNFRLATGLPLEVNAAVDYSTNSTVFSGIPNEYQVSLRRHIVRQGNGSPFDATLTAAYNFAPQSVDGELVLARRLGRVRLLGTVRGISSGYDVQRSLWGLGGGAVVRLTDWLSLAGDAFDLVNVNDAAVAMPAWGVGAQIRIPYTPHTLSIQVTNTHSATIEGSSQGIRDEAMLGFEFTIPFTLSRYFGKRAHPAADTTRTAADTAAAPVTGSAAVKIANYAFGTGEIHVRPGTRVRWANSDPLEHSVTADDGSFDSGLIAPGHSYEHVFSTPGTYAYHCTPHPFMHGKVVVEGAP